MEEVIWVTVAEFPAYAVSNDGRVRRVTPGQGARCRMITPAVSKTGYYKVRMCMNGVTEQRTLHSVVAAAFIGARPEGMEINHKDGDKANNRPENLEYVTHSENLSHAYATGLLRPQGSDKTHCKHGHAFDEANTGYYLGKRRCRACDRRKYHEKQARLREAA